MKRDRIEIIGKGNLGWHLERALGAVADVNVVPSRTLEGIRSDADIYLVCVADDMIAKVAAEVAARMPHDAVLAHTSGAAPLRTIDRLHENTGVFYPLQTFSREVPLDYSEIPFLIEASNEQNAEKLAGLARKISGTVLHCDSDQRGDIHVASATACNFANRLWALADDYLTARGLDFDIMKPLLKETLRKALEMPPFRAQTGPARRGDDTTIASHLRRLEKDSEMREIYEMMTRSIRKAYN